ncbi:helix-turn-helix transcriptional regulator [Naasia lichenicola]|uniref:WYL domain-containing protein n=1 Tax=Naasia lichenicola TaxID=2565933 RepID=A0A4S4FTT8_9MICO|nr:WYL domain-containing protein [Naasia lichenicola]THG33402.1 WYL domain-containing protein [Naasia lichenicola]
MAADAISVEERLFSLVLALVATEHGLTKAEILSNVQGYRQRYEVRGDNASLERQFERDKDDIRELGVPLETIESPQDAGNNQNLRYRIPKGAYDLPSEVSFTPEEVTLLNLAGEVWREGSLSSESHRALLKLASLGIAVDDPTIGYAPRVRVREPAFGPLTSAIERQLVVKFPYFKPGERTALLRTVAPLALVQHQGRWHLSSIDRDRDEPRTFLLSRIVGPVTTTRTVFERPAGVDSAAAALAELDRVLQLNTVVIAVEPGSDAESRFVPRAIASTAAADGELPTHTLNYSDQVLMADELASYGPEVRVIRPVAMRDQVIARLRAVAEAHSAARDEAAGAPGASPLTPAAPTSARASRRQAAARTTR